MHTIALNGRTVDVDAIRCGDLSPWDWHALTECAAVAAQLPAPLFVEIGTNTGRTARGIMTALNSLGLGPVEYVGVDPGAHAATCWNANVVTSRAGQSHRLRFFNVPSVEAAREVAAGSVAFAFVDGCHCEECASVDMDTWAPRIAPGGFLCLHDSHPALTGRKQKNWGHERRRPIGVRNAIESRSALLADLGFALHVEARNEANPDGPQKSTTVFRKA